MLLHSEVGDSGAGHSYLLGLNGTELGTDDQLGAGCGLRRAGGVASLSGLTASGGLANNLTSGAAEVLGVQTALGLDPVQRLRHDGQSGRGRRRRSSRPSPPPSPASTRPGRVSPAAAPTTSAAALPRTGVAALSMAASALAALLSGLVLRVIGRRRVAA